MEPKNSMIVPLMIFIILYRTFKVLLVLIFLLFILYNTDFFKIPVGRIKLWYRFEQRAQSSLIMYARFFIVATCIILNISCLLSVLNKTRVHDIILLLLSNYNNNNNCKMTSRNNIVKNHWQDCMKACQNNDIVN